MSINLRQQELSGRLRGLGLSQSECEVYLEILGYGSFLPARAARKLGIPRTTLYSILKSLETKGLVSSEGRRRPTRFRAHEPVSLIRWFEQRQADLALQEEKLKAVLPDLQLLYRPSGGRSPRVTVVEGEAEVMRFLLARSSQWQTSVLETDRTHWGYQDPSLVERFRPFLEHVWKIRKPGESIQLLSHRSETERRLKQKIAGRSIKFLPSEVQFASSVWVSGEYVCFAVTRGDPPYLVEVQDQLLAGNMRSLFQLLWRSLSPGR